MSKTSFCPFLVLSLLMIFGGALPAMADRLSLSLGGLGDLASLNTPTGANRGLGVAGALEVRLDSPFAFGLDGGLVEFIAPTNHEDMKTTWLDLMGRFYPLPQSPLGEAYLQGSFGVCPDVSGLFEDYWTVYFFQVYGHIAAQPPSGQIDWNTRLGAGWLLPLGGPWSLDLQLNTAWFWPPANPLLETYDLGAQARYTFDLGGAP